ncbi:cell division topological specificity factor MinE [Acetobacter orientalis]|uniref:Cell division topological specificity factor n=1 Tax=Acetobacter orientalis TaxID=146474 RepID=A0A252A6P9_9PROT|nr:cell division topological specificity factor MinE [Acetobacter orientalis]MCP1222608.1 cell division topological specificity factor MinE [Acetobacter orientalis]OUI85227.1 cell division topological specificity factor MinE [Acetobacter orientalis]BBC78872.1 cell division topological specificity factor MinE [Acetobacter orientalis]GAN66166.1 cell division topological specificity factor MinE [Acetobacter orientalis]GBR16214.1 cell division topological specificity factor MinE [Acetobacter orien
MSSFLSSFFKKRSSAPIARDRLQILLAHERISVGDGKDDLLAQLHREIMEVIKRHVAIDQDKVQIKLDRQANCSLLEIDVEVPGLTDKKPAVAAQKA